MISSIYNFHNVLLSNDIYEFVDPNYASNYMKSYIPTKLDIIEYIETNNIDNIVVKYNNIYDIKYIILNKSKIRISPVNQNSCHLMRLIWLKKMKNYDFDLDVDININDLSDIIIEICDLINDKPFDYCTVCGIKLELKCDLINCCSLNSCQIQSKHIVIDNRIIDLYKKDPFLCEVLINILVEGVNHPKGEKIFSPFPVIKNITNLNKLKQTIISQKNNLEISNISTSQNDIELHKKIGNISYAIINNAIMDNHFSLNTIEKVIINNPMNVLKMEMNTASDHENFKIIGLNYPIETENNFKKEYFLFHGTPLSSWFPIIKNGLKIMSNTEFMTNGSAYGNGIYLSDEFSMSLGYSTMNNNGNNKKIVGVFEIANKIDQYKKTQSIYVVSNEKVLLLRYLIVVKNNLSSITCTELSKYFVKQLSIINNTNKQKFDNVKTKRFNIELKLLCKNTNVVNVNVINEMENWKIELDEINGKKISLDIYFNDYPQLPPKILLDCDFSFKNNISNENLESIIPEINISQWNITTNLSSLVDMFHKRIINFL